MDPQQAQEPGQYSVFEEMGRPLINATVGQRFLNYIIDLLVFYMFSYMVGLLLAILQNITGANLTGFMLDEYGKNTIGLYVFSISLYILWYIFLEGVTRGRTLGKTITGTKAVKEDGELITWKDAVLRSLCRLIPFEPLSALGSFPWHDTITKTMVIKTRGIGTK